MNLVNKHKLNSIKLTPISFGEGPGVRLFGARYVACPDERGNSVPIAIGIRVWLSVDPMADDYPHQSPYSYVGNRPIMVIDPNGMDELEFDYETGKTTKINENKYYRDAEGNVNPATEDQVRAGKNLVDKITNSAGESKYYTEKSIKETSKDNTNVSIFDNADEAKDFYYFAAESSNVEWAVGQYNDWDGTTSGMVGTNHEKGETSMISNFEEMWGDRLYFASHSHNLGGEPSGVIKDYKTGRKGGDIYQAFNSSFDYAREVYDVQKNNIYTYSNRTYYDKNIKNSGFDTVRPKN